MFAVSAGCCTLVAVFALQNSYRFVEKQHKKIYILDGGKSLVLALSQDLSRNRPAEAREHVRGFYELFSGLSPQKDAIGHNINRALQLVDKSVYHYHADSAKKGYYNHLIFGNISQVVRANSVVCDFSGYPYRVRTYARQMIIRESGVTEHSLVTDCQLQSTSHSDDNLNSFVIERLIILEDKDIKSVEQ